MAVGCVYFMKSLSSECQRVVLVAKTFQSAAIVVLVSVWIVMHALVLVLTVGTVVSEECVNVVSPSFALACLCSSCLLVVELWVPLCNDFGPSVDILLCYSLCL